ncbi:MAG: hypothetical protein ACI9LO_003441 [Planctomycetota bacterium]|jgi:uncharacterized protein GlcG (DUF336 family)
MKCLNKTIFATITLAAIFSAQTADPSPTLTLRSLAPPIAHQMVFAAVDDCSRRGYKVSAAVVDRHGNLAAFLRDPLSGPHTIEVSQRKAYSSASLQTATSQMAGRTDLSFAPGILLIVGGLPIEFGGNFYGGVAVSGAEPEIDEACAQAGIDAVADAIEFAD